MNPEELVARLHEIEARAAKATAGPWEVADYNENYPERDTWLGVIQGAFEILEERFQVGRVKYSALPPVENYANAAFIAAGREDVPWLCARLREALGLSPSSDATRPHD